jgi:hypothetical protein
MHQIPIGKEKRYTYLNNSITKDNRASNGCPNLSQADFETYNQKFPKKGCPVYILPEELNKDGKRKNRMKIVDDKISFTPVDRSICKAKVRCHEDYYFSPSHSEDNSKKIDVKIFNNERSNNPVVKKYIQTMINEKSSLMQELKISNEQYNELAQLAYAILGVESGFGVEDRYQVKEGLIINQGGSKISGINSTVGKYVQDNSQKIGQEIVSVVKTAQGKKSSNSRGLTQIKNIKKYVSKYPAYSYINDNNISDPKNAFIATIIVLTEKKKELPQIAKTNKNINRDNEQEHLDYIYKGSTGQLKNRTATPKLSIRGRELKQYLDEIHIYEEL